MDADLNVETPRLVLRPMGEDLIDAVVRYYVRNREHLAPWDPRRPNEYYTRPYWEARVATFADDEAHDRNYRFCMVARAPMGAVDAGEVAGTVGVSNVVRGVLQSANLGFAVDATLQGQGVAHEGVRAVMGLAFGVIDLHRLEAGHRVENVRSGALLTRLGFERIGVARRYLLVDGAWRDHVLYQRLADEVREP